MKSILGNDDPLDRTEVDHWLSFAIGPLRGAQSLTESLDYLDRILMPRTWLAAKRLTIADICVFSALSTEGELVSDEKYPNITRWYKQINSLPATKSAMEMVLKNRKTTDKKVSKPRGKQVDKENKGQQNSNARKQEGKFIELPGAEMGKVIAFFFLLKFYLNNIFVY